MNQSAYFLARIENLNIRFHLRKIPLETGSREFRARFTQRVILPHVYVAWEGVVYYLSLPREIQEAAMKRGQSNKDRTGHAQIPTRNNIFL